MSFRFNHSREQVWGAVMRPASTKYIHLTPRFPYTQPVCSQLTLYHLHLIDTVLGKKTKTSCFVLLSARLLEL